jgi:hypothetical protein
VASAPSVLLEWAPLTSTLDRMKLSLDAKQRWLVALCLGAFMALAFVVGWFLGMLPTIEEKCEAQCKAKGMWGHMEYIYPEPMTRGVRGRGPQECKCSR